MSAFATRVTTFAISLSSLMFLTHGVHVDLMTFSLVVGIAAFVTSMPVLPRILIKKDISLLLPRGRIKTIKKAT